MSNGKLLKKNPVNSDQHCFVAMYAVFWLLFLHVKAFFFFVTFDSLVMFCLDYGHCSAYIFNKLTSVFHASVLLLIMNFVITLSK